MRLGIALAALAGLAVLCVAADPDLMQPEELAARLDAKGNVPAVFCTGQNVFYRSKHIPGSIFAGPANSPQGIELLKAEAGKLPRTREIVLYCGCCPWDRCPNVKPAVELLRAMGFQKVRTVYMQTGFKADWIDRGYAVESGQ